MTHTAFWCHGGASDLNYTVVSLQSSLGVSLSFCLLSSNRQQSAQHAAEAADRAAGLQSTMSEAGTREELPDRLRRTLLSAEYPALYRLLAPTPLEPYTVTE